MVKRAGPVHAALTREPAAPIRFPRHRSRDRPRAGDIQMARRSPASASTRRERSISSPKWISSASGCAARHRRALSRARRAGRGVEGGRRRARAARAIAGCSIRSTARRTTRTGCRSSARRWRSRSTARRSRRRLRPDPQRAVHGRARGLGAYLNGGATAGVRARRADRRAARHPGFPTTCTSGAAIWSALFGAFLSPGARGPAAGLGGARPLLRRGRAGSTASGSSTSSRGTWPRGR